MTCIKTGCHAYLHEYGEWIYGDAHQFGNLFVFRVAGRSFTPFSGIYHFTIYTTLASWTDQPYGTIISDRIQNHGYEGVPL